MAQLIKAHVFISGNSAAQGVISHSDFFSEFFINGKRTLDTDCFGADFPWNFSFGKITGSSLTHRRKPGRIRNSGREFVGKVDHGSQSDASAGSTGLTGEELIPEIRDLLREGYTGKWTRCFLAESAGLTGTVRV